MDNTMRGIWCEYMVAEALGTECKTVGFGWNAWDLQIGESGADLPDRIRIQVKNNARMQVWNAGTKRLSDATFSLPWRRRPDYFERYTPGVPCEAEGFLCDVFILCHHPETDGTSADQRDPSQWEFYILPVRGPNCAVTESEIASMRAHLAKGKARASTIRRPETLQHGIRGRPKIEPIRIDQLSIRRIRKSLGLEVR